MAPGRKRGGAKGAKAKSQLNLGDLVLAKVKGFPAWPAKISKPEDWERAPDPKKYFVQFFGTEEIAFVAPIDIQPFTSESKNKLLAKCKGKTVKYFSQAVREICDTFEELQNKSSDSLKDGNDGQSSQPDANSTEMVDEGGTDGQSSQPGANSTEMVDDGMAIDGLNGETSLNDIVDNGPGLERCSHIHGEMEHEDVKPSVSPIINGHSPFPVSTKKCFELCNDDATSPKEETITISGAGHVKILKSQLKVEANGQNSKKIAKASKKSSDGDHGISKIHSPAGASSSVQTSHPESAITENSKDGIRSSSHGSKSEVTGGAVSPEHGGHLKNAKTALKDKTHIGVSDDLSKDVEGDSTGRNGVELAGRKMKSEHGLGKDNVLNNGVLYPTNRFKCLDDVPNRSQTYRQKDVSVKGGNGKVKDSTPSMKTKNRLASKGQPNILDSGEVGDGDVQPPTKRRRRALDVMSGSSKMSEYRIDESSIPSEKEGNSDAVQSKAQGTLKRRAVHICDDDEDEPKTPVHGRTPRVDKVSHISVSVNEGSAATEVTRDSPGLRNSIVHAKKAQLSSEQLSLPLSPNSRQESVEIVEGRSSHSPGEDESKKKKTCAEVLKVLASPANSSVMVDAYNPTMEPPKANKSLGKVSGNVLQKKGQAGPFKASTGNHDGGHHSQNNTVNERSRPAISAEKQKFTPKLSVQVTDSSAALRKPGDRTLSSSERLEFLRVERSTLSADPRSVDSNKSMKHLIAVAQAKRKQAQLQNFGHDNLNISHVMTTDAISRSPGFIASVQPILAGPGLTVQTDGQGYLSQKAVSSPSRVHHFKPIDQPDPAEVEETRTSSGHRTAGGSLSGGTEAAVARDAFEGMIETLSRTKESIGRATRHAIDCAKHGIANEVVELLTRKLESESSFHRRVDLFFLVDSITQCSHSQKGIAGASYIPTVQAALPRLLGAAAPPGVNARENRRQCLKVLKLWLERKILPDTLLRSYIEDIGPSNDDASGGFFSKRPSRSERAVDDPIREMEGMLVDEYGSNATFQMPGFLSSNVFEEEEDDILNFSHKEGLGKSTLDVDHTTGELETCSATPNDKRHCILEDVDGELEMEDVSGHQKDEKISTGGSYKAVEHEEGSDRIIDSASNNSNEASPSRDGSPPLPLDSPPPTPPLPSSPPPPLSPMVPPPPSSPSPPPPPPPPQSPSQTYTIHPPIVGPSQPSFPQPPLLSHSSLPQASTAAPHAYQSSVPSILPLNTRLGVHVDAAVRGDMFSLQPSSFVSAVASGSCEPSGYHSLRTVDYGHETYTNSQSNQQFQTANIPLPSRAFQTPMPPQTVSGQFQYTNAAMRSHPYQPIYGLTKHADAPRRYGADEQWMPPSNEFTTDNQRGAWISSSRPPLSSGPPFAQEGYFRPPMERPPANNISIQPTGQNKVPSGSSIPGLSGSMMMSSLNSWRPA